MAYIGQVCKRPVTVGARSFPCAVSGFGQVLKNDLPKTCRPAADEAPRHTREKTSGTQGSAQFFTI